jgi:tRNA-2-methylthio-N6-dimethylallyladenosine synthase
MKRAGESERRRYFIETWGCQMNVHDSEKLAGSLEREGYVRAGRAEDADVILLNTCSIREKAVEKVFSEVGRLRSLKRRRPGTIVGLCGCVAQQEGDKIFERAPEVDLVVGPRATASLPRLIGRLDRGDRTARHAVDTEYRDDSIRFPYEAIRREGLHTRKAFVTVIEGCNHRCTFCVVPMTRGREVCREMDEIVDEVGSLVSKGICEVEFLGQTVNAYRDRQGRTLADLIRTTAEIDGVSRIRFTTSHPAQMTDRLMNAMANARPKVCPYLHLPAQSGSSAVLQSMRRGYDRTGYLNKVDALRARMPELALGTDMIVGFPTETDDDFEATLSLLDDVRFDTVYSFVYSPRPGTAALGMQDTTPVEIKQERLARLQARQRSIQEQCNREWIGRQVEVLVEGPSKRDVGEWCGRTPEYRVVNFPGASAPGRLETLRIVDSGPFSLRGEPLRRELS